MGHEGGAIKGEETPEVIYFVDHRQPKGHEYVILGYRNFKEGEEQPIGNSNDIIFDNRGRIAGYRTGGEMVRDSRFDPKFELWGTADRTTHHNYSIMRTRERLTKRMFWNNMKYYLKNRGESIGTDPLGRELRVARIKRSKSKYLELFDPRAFDYKTMFHNAQNYIAHEIGYKFLFQYPIKLAQWIKTNLKVDLIDPFSVAEWDASISPLEGAQGLPVRIGMIPYSTATLYPAGGGEY
jgi:hypothetical protein